MSTHRVWQEPGGELKIEVFTSDDPALKAWTEKQMKDGGFLHKNAKVLVDGTKAEVEALLPKNAAGKIDRSEREKWRWKNSKVEVDPTVPPQAKGPGPQ